MSTLLQQLETLTGKTIISFEEWEYVYFVKFASGRPTFVSKRKIAMESLNLNVLSPVTWTLEASMRRQEGKKWVARITGKDEKYGLARQFISPTAIEWGKYGMKKAVFELDAPGYYQDSDGDYFKVFVGKIPDGFDAECCSKAEVQHHFSQVAAK